MPGVMIYMEDMDMFYDVLTDAEIGSIMKAVKEYVKNGKEPENLTPAATICFRVMKVKIDRDIDKYQSKVSNGNQGGRPPKNKTGEEANETERKPKETEQKANETETDITSNYVTSNSVSRNDISGDKSPEKRAREGRFDRFWEAYPKKVAKEPARKAFYKLKPDDVLTDRMIRAVEEAKVSAQWRKDGGQYIPNPATWLNQRRWEDEVPASESPPDDIFANV